jgi:hypothetical protein
MNIDGPKEFVITKFDCNYGTKNHRVKNGIVPLASPEIPGILEEDNRF